MTQIHERNLSFTGVHYNSNNKTLNADKSSYTNNQAIRTLLSAHPLQGDPTSPLSLLKEPPSRLEASGQRLNTSTAASKAFFEGDANQASSFFTSIQIAQRRLT